MPRVGSVIVSVLAFLQSRNVGAVAFTPSSFAQAVQFFLEVSQLSQSAQRKRSGVAVHFANAYNIALADSNLEYKKLLDEADYVFADGTPVIWAAKLLHRDGRPCWERIYGPDFMRSVLSQSTTEQRHFLLGSTETVLEKLHHAIERDYQNAKVVGTYSPPFDDQPDPDEIFRRDAAIRAAMATHVWIGMGTPKQDFEVRRIADEHAVYAFAVGAAFNYISGCTKEAPKIVQKTGLQWLHRLLLEPRRLLRRYLWGNPRFIWSVIRTFRSIS